MKAIRNIVCVVLILAICVRVYERTGGETSEEAETPQAPVENVLTESYLFYPYQYASKNGIPLRGIRSVFRDKLSFDQFRRRVLLPGRDKG